MRCLRMLTAIAVLMYVSVTWAGDNMPPVPKSHEKSAVANHASLTPAPMPTMAPPQPETTAILKVKIVQEDAGCEAAPLPPPTKSASTPSPASEGGCQTVASSPMPSVAGPVQKHCCCHCTCACCQAKKKCGLICFLANEFLRKPIYDVQKAVNDAEGRRLCCEECRLNKELEWLTAEAARLAEKLQNCRDNDLDAKFKLLREEAAYARDANRNAVKRAKLECQKADYCEQKQRLEEKHDDLFPARD